MSYINGKDILPEEVLVEVQKYYNGGLIYIPIKESRRSKWGAKTSTKTDLAKRNQEICDKKRNGISIEELMEEYHLAYDTIRRIIYR